MASNVALYIALEPERGGPVSLARVKNPDALVRIARMAVSEARSRARAALQRDPTLGLLQTQEASHLEQYFRMLIPGFPAEITAAN